jgi:hypothetical protein
MARPCASHPRPLQGNVASHADHFGLVYAHMLGGTIMLFCGAINLYIGATRRHFRHHRLVGRTYLVGGLIAAVIAVVVTLGPNHKSDASVIFTNASTSLSMLASAWLLAASLVTGRHLSGCPGSRQCCCAKWPCSGAQVPRSRYPPRPIDTISDSPRVGHFRGKTTLDGPRVMPENSRKSKTWK